MYNDGDNDHDDDNDGEMSNVDDYDVAVVVTQS